MPGRIYHAAWIYSAGVFALITWNRIALDYGGILGISGGEHADYWQVALGIAFVFVPVLTLMLLFRLLRKKPVALFEMTLCVCTWVMLAFNLSFWRG